MSKLCQSYILKLNGERRLKNSHALIFRRSQPVRFYEGMLLNCKVINKMKEKQMGYIQATEFQ